MVDLPSEPPRFSSVEEEDRWILRELRKEHAALSVAFRDHGEAEDRRWKLLRGNGEAGMFERVRLLERWANIQQRLGWVILTALGALVVKAAWDLFRAAPQLKP